jgi:DNA-binding LacI/PurR family transcriptional regulator
MYTGRAEQAMSTQADVGKRLKAPTMADVAELAGVSPQTVSRVLRSHPNVSEVTRLQVEDAVDRLGYRRTGLARALVTGRSMIIGVLTHETAQYSPAAMMLGVRTAARERGYFVSAAGTTSMSSAAITDGISHLRDQGVDGLVIAVPVWDEVSLGRVTDGLPIAVVDGVASSAEDIITLDQEAAGRMATQHLIDLGHETIWHIAGPSAWKDASGRTTGWEAALIEAGLAVQPVLHGDWTAESGYRNGLVIGQLPDATAVFVSSDEMAFGVIRALADLGKRVPEDVSVIGMDDIPLAKFATPPLTTIRQPFELMGRTAVEHVLNAIDDPTAPREGLTIAPEIIVRASTAARR